MIRMIFALATAISAGVANAGTSCTISPIDVPVDSPLALVGLATAMGLVILRLMRNRSK